MSLTDPEYGVLYFRACTMNPFVSSIVRPPVVGRPPINTRSPATLQTSPPMNIQAAKPASQSPTNGATRPPMTCYGCGKTGHGMNACPEINSLMANGTIDRDQTGRIVMKDHGSRIFRKTDEPFVVAIQRQTGATTHYITADPKLSYYSQATIKEYDNSEDIQ